MNNALESALKAIEKFKGCKTIEYRGNSFPCDISDNTMIANLEGGGLADVIDQIFIVRKSVFVDGIYPQSKETIIFNSTTYRISKVQSDGLDTFLQLLCTDPNRGI